MKANDADEIKIVNTTKEDLKEILWLFEQVLQWQGKNGYKVWNFIDEAALEKDIEERLQYKITRHDNILCIFTVGYRDPFTWGERDQSDAIYLHRIVTNPLFKGQRQFENVLWWTKQLARLNNLPYIRMDTWADNSKIIRYYKSFGFEFVGNYKTPDAEALPLQNRNLHVALLELKV